ncbi:chaplin [Streptomyces sp. NPDC092296]|uniref:chaplin n=1 Tax=Streptomyces sp. NPDC092296 TaxID=3366012 RepID=UPI003827360A
MNTIKKAAVLVAASGCLVAAGAGTASAGGAEGAAVGSPGVLSGNVVQVPITIPINLCGNGINILALLNPVGGNTCINAEGGRDRGHREFGGELIRGREGGRKERDREDRGHDKGRGGWGEGGHDRGRGGDRGGDWGGR